VGALAGLGVSRLALGGDSEAAKARRSKLTRMRKGVTTATMSGYKECHSVEECLAKTSIELKKYPSSRHGYVFLKEAHRVMSALKTASFSDQMGSLILLEKVIALFRVGKFGKGEDVAEAVTKAVGAVFDDHELLYKLYLIPGSNKVNGAAIKHSFYGHLPHSAYQAQGPGPDDAPFFRQEGQKNGKTFKDEVIHQLTSACQVAFGLAPAAPKPPAVSHQEMLGAHVAASERTVPPKRATGDLTPKRATGERVSGERRRSSGPSNLRARRSGDVDESPHEDTGEARGVITSRGAPQGRLTAEADVRRSGDRPKEVAKSHVSS